MPQILFLRYFCGNPRPAAPGLRTRRVGSPAIGWLLLGPALQVDRHVSVGDQHLPGHRHSEGDLGDGQRPMAEGDVTHASRTEQRRGRGLVPR